LKQKTGKADIELKTAADIRRHAALRQGGRNQEIGAACWCRSWTRGRTMSAGHNGDDLSMSALMRLVASFRAWRRRRIAARHSFMVLSDRMLADIGVHRADVFGAAVGAVPLARTAAPLGEAPADAKVCQLPRRRALTVVPNELSAAA
jgi:uncharacterized protein YjiS (DUF1127 family)